MHNKSDHEWRCLYCRERVRIEANGDETCTGCGICQGCYKRPCECLPDDAGCDPE